MKHIKRAKDNRVVKVTPFVGVWIETVKAGESYKLVGVTPFVGVWIETTLSFVSLPIL